MTDAEKQEQLQNLMDSFISNLAQRANADKARGTESDINPTSTEGIEPDSYDDYEEDFPEQEPQINNGEGGFQAECPNPPIDPTPIRDTEVSEEEPFSTPTPEPEPDVPIRDTEGGEEEPISTPTPEPISDSSSNSTSNNDKTFNFDADGWKRAWLDSMQACRDYYSSPDVVEQMEKERASNTQPPQVSNPLVYKKETATFNGQEFKYRVYQNKVNWGNDFGSNGTTESKISNLEKLNEKIIKDIEDIFGGLERITDIAVISEMLIINGVQYYPLCNDKAFLNSMPFDCMSYFKEGLLAEIFDFGYLFSMPLLTNLKFDSISFVVRKFAYDIGIYTEFKSHLVFKRFKNLKLLEIGDVTIPYPGKVKDKNLNNNIKRQSAVRKAYDGYVVGNVSTFRGWTFDNLKTYSCNRGDKGLFKYFGGILARGALTTTVGVGELGLRAVGGVVKGGAFLLKKAFKGDV